MGIGLNICRNIVKYIGPLDNLIIESKEHEGSTFSF